MKKHLKTGKLVASLAILSFCISLNNASWADTIVDSNLNNDLKTQEISLSEDENKNDIIAAQVCPIASQAPAENQDAKTTVSPCNNSQEYNPNETATSAEVDEDKNIVPVLDLKGGVQTEEITEETKKETPIEIWLNNDTATGDWGGLRKKLEDNGVTISSFYMMNSFTKMRRGGIIDRRKPSYQGLINTSAEFDTEKMHLYPGGKLYVLFENIHGQGLSSRSVGDYMYFNSYESDRTGPQLSEYWYEQSFLNDKLKFKIGKQDANTDFMALDTGFEFINSGFGTIANAFIIPTYPNAAMGLVTTIQPTENTYLKYGFLDGNGVGSQSGFNTIFHKDSSYMHIAEVGVTHSIKNHPGKLLYGMWLHTADTDELLSPALVDAGAVPRTLSNTKGLYAEFEQMIFKENKDDEEDTQGLTMIGQFGWAPPARSEVTKHFGVGLAYQGAIPKRDDDLLGIGANFAKFSNKLGHLKGENILELFYKVQLTPWLCIQPDIQYINKPYYSNKSNFVIGFRTIIDL